MIPLLYYSCKAPTMSVLVVNIYPDPVHYFAALHCLINYSWMNEWMNEWINNDFRHIYLSPGYFPLSLNTWLKFWPVNLNVSLLRSLWICQIIWKMNVSPYTTFTLSRWCFFQILVQDKINTFCCFASQHFNFPRTWKIFFEAK